MIRLALIDGPLAPDHPALDRQERFRDGPQGPASAHAAALADAVLTGCASARIENLAIFSGGLSTDAATVARALGAVRAEVTLCAFGLTRPDPSILAAVAALLARGTTIIAASPARGVAVWPAACPGVIAVQGDARCTPGDWSHLALPHATFGACPAIPGHPGVAGASAAAGHLAGIAARMQAEVGTAEDLASRLVAGAKWHGRERRSAAI